MLQHRSRRLAFYAGFLLALAWLSARSSLVEPVGAAEAGPYFVEFRVATIGAYGHSYAAYGSGSHVKYADLHPMGNYALMAIGHVLPVPANTEWDPEVLKLPIASRYRVSLTAAQYNRLVVAIAK